MKINQIVLSFVLSLAIILTIAACNQKQEWTLGQPLSKNKIKLAIIHPNRLSNDSSYDYAHFKGISEMQAELELSDSQIIRHENVFENDPALVEAVIREDIDAGANIIIASSWGYKDVCEKLAAEYPNIIFAQGPNHSNNGRNLTSFILKTYEARYLSGIVAGLRTKTNMIGYVAAKGKENSEVTRDINAFALGVESVNPEARIHVKVIHNWFDPMGETQTAITLIDLGCDVITEHANTPHPIKAAERRGIWSIGYNTDMHPDAPQSVITSVVLNWGMYYTKLIKSIIDGSFKAENYFEGLSSGIVEISPINESLAASGTLEKITETKQEIINGKFNIFIGPLVTNDDQIIGSKNTLLSDEELFTNMTWYYRNIIEE